MLNSGCCTEENSLNTNNKMRKINYIIVLIILFITVACNENKNKSVKNEIAEKEIRVVKEYAYEGIDIYYVNPKLHPILDSIVETVRGCSKLNEKGLIYFTSVHKEENSLPQISIDLQRQKDIYCPTISGIFTYKNAIFVIGENIQIDSLFVNTGLKTKFKCQKENILMHDHNDFTKGGWTYVIEDGKFKCISYGICGKQWMDERYYKFEDNK
jgi:hypothetical protein